MKTFLLVKKLLEQYPELRSDDKLLQWKMLELQGKIINGYLSYQGFRTAKSTETIRRTRQMVQEKHPELGPVKEVEKMREQRQQSKGSWVFRDDVAIFTPSL